MTNEKSMGKIAVKSFLFSIFTSILFSPLFSELYIYIFKPVFSGGLFVVGNSELFGLIQNSIFAYQFFLPLFVMYLVPRKQWLVWSILVILPLLMSISGGRKYMLCFVIFTISGALIGWGLKSITLIYQNKNSRK